MVRNRPSRPVPCSPLRRAAWLPAAALIALLPVVSGCDLGATGADTGTGILDVWVIAEGTGAALVPVTLAGAGSGSIEKFTDAEGRATFLGLREGTYLVEARARPGVRFSTSSAEVSVGSERESIEIPAEFTRDSHLWVQVLVDGEPRQGVRVSLSGAEERQALTDDEGYVKWSGLRYGRFEIVASDPAGAYAFPASPLIATLAPEAVSNARISGETVALPLQIVTPMDLPTATLGRAFTQILEARGATAPYGWEAVAGGVPGLVLSGSGVLSGVPTEAGVFSLGVRVLSGEASAEATFSLLVQIAPLQIVSPGQLAPLLLGQEFATTLEALGGVGDYRWSMLSGGIPGVSLSSTGALAGVPTAAGDYTFVAEVRSGVQTAEAVFEASVGTLPLTIVSTDLPSAALGAAYVHQMEAVGGHGSFEWTVVSGTLPAGMELLSTGLITGTPTDRGVAFFTVRAASGGAFVEADVSLEVTGPPLVILSEIPTGYVNVDFEVLMVASGGDGDYRWEVVRGTMPPGTRIFGSGPVFQGRPTEAGVWEFDVQVRSGAQAVIRTYRVEVIRAPDVFIEPIAPLEVVFGRSLPPTQLLTTGGSGEYAWRFAGGEIPPGIKIDQGGLLHGSSCCPGTYEFDVRVESRGAVDTASATMVVHDVGPGGLVLREDWDDYTAPFLIEGNTGRPYTASVFWRDHRFAVTGPPGNKELWLDPNPFEHARSATFLHPGITIPRGYSYGRHVFFSFDYRRRTPSSPRDFTFWLGGLNVASTVPDYRPFVTACEFWLRDTTMSVNNGVVPAKFEIPDQERYLFEIEADLDEGICRFYVDGVLYSEIVAGTPQSVSGFQFREVDADGFVDNIEMWRR